jgi:hypothetical protein
MRKVIEENIRKAEEERPESGIAGDNPPKGGIGGKASSFVSGLGFVVVMSLNVAADAVISHVTGTPSLSSSAEAMFRDIDNGNQSFADLDAVDAALELSGGAADAATMAVGVFFEAGDAYANGL